MDRHIFNQLKPITSYDLERHSALELMMFLAKYFNELLELTLNVEQSTSSELSAIKNKLDKLLTDSLGESVLNQLEQWVNDGFFDIILNQAITRINDVGISVKLFGATGDGFTDDTQAIKKALETIGKLGGGIIHFPKGVYRWCELLTIYPNTTLILNQEAVIKRDHDGAILINGERGKEYPPYGAHSNIKIDGGIWDGNVNRQNGGYNMLNFGKASNIIIQNATFKDYSGGHVFDISGCRDMVIDNCRFIGFRPTTNREFAEAIQIAEHTALGFEYFGSHDASICENITIQNCYFGRSGTGATYGVNGIGTHGGTHNVFNKNIRILNNTFEHSYNAGVRAFKYDDVIIDGNIFDGCKKGVAISSVVGGSQSSHDKEGVQSNMCQSGTGYKIINNTFRNCTHSSIDAWGQAYQDDSTSNYSKIKDIVIENNTFEKCTGENNISLILCSDVKIKHNTFKDLKRAIRSVLCDHLFVDGNNVDGCTLEMIYVYESPSVFPFYNEQGLSNHIYIRDNIVNEIGLTGIFLNGKIKHGQVNNNHLTNICVKSAISNNRNGITVSGGCEDFNVIGNRVESQESPKNVYGVLVTNTCKNVLTSSNFGDGDGGGVYNSSIGALSDKAFTNYQNKSNSSLTYMSIGDSITNAGSYQQIVCQMTGFGNHVKFAQSGVTSIDMVNKILEGGEEWVSADVYTLMIGINDFRKDVPLGGSENESTSNPTTFGGAVKRIIQEIYKKSGKKAKIFVIAPFKNWEENYKFNEPNGDGRVLKDYVEILKNICSYYSLPFINLYDVGEINTWTQDIYLSDGLHPTWEGHQLIGTKIGKAMRNNF